ncbi:snare associated Golgi protein-domain-containing protein, partial [Endogone sp. FLAS-F59071]
MSTDIEDVVADTKISLLAEVRIDYGTIEPPVPQPDGSSTSASVPIEKHNLPNRPSYMSDSYKWSLFALVLTLAVMTTAQYVLLKATLPAVDSEHRDALKIPRSLHDLRELNAVLNVYIEKHYMNVLIAFVSSYLYLQTFSIPGSMWLNVLSGALFNFWYALLLVCLCSALGATNAYLISYNLGSVFVKRNFGERITRWNEQLSTHRRHMFNYILVVRIVPLPPNWLVNIGAPHLDVPIRAFFWGTFFGWRGPGPPVIVGRAATGHTVQYYVFGGRRDCGAGTRVGKETLENLSWGDASAVET